MPVLRAGEDESGEVGPALCADRVRSRGGGVACTAESAYCTPSRMRKRAERGVALREAE